MSNELTQTTWFGVEPPDPEAAKALRSTPRALKATDPNPALAVYGHGPRGATCGTCALLERPRRYAKTYRKCRLRGDSHGEGTDHYASWPACGKYVKEDEV